LLLPKEVTDWGSQEPDRKTMGSFTYTIYMGLMTLVHHFYLILLEWLQFGDFLYFTGKLTATSLLSMLLFLVTDLLISRNTRTR
jgi:hypothetical protein